MEGALMREMELNSKVNRREEILNYLKRKSEKEKNKDKTECVVLLYFFSSPDTMGIRMVDCSTKGYLARFVGTTGIEENTLSKKNGTFITRQSSPTYVDWDDDLNEINKATYVKRPQGNDDVIYIIYTFIVSEKELKNIGRQVNEKEPDSDNLIRIIVEDLYSFDEEYRFYKKLISKNQSNKMGTNSLLNENSTIKTIEQEEKKLGNSIANIKNSKKALQDFKKFINNMFPKNKLGKSIEINNEDKSKGNFDI